MRNKIKGWLLPLLLLACGSMSVFAQDWPGLNRYRAANEQLAAAPSNRVVFMGDSITDLWDDTDSTFFVDHAYANRGISGQTTPQMLVRFRADVIQLQPAAVVILAGTNDIAGNTGPSTLGMIEDNLASMGQLAQANNIKVVLCSLTPAYAYPWSKGKKPAPKIKKLNDWIRQYASQHGFTYCNYYPALVNAKGGMKKKYSKDGVHPTPAGYSVMEPIVVRAIKKSLGQ